MDQHEGPESQDSDFHDEYLDDTSSPNVYRSPPHLDLQLANDGAAQFNDGNTKAAEDHTPDVVEDTQFVEIEAETQVNQDSNLSFVAETQYDDLEADTQAVDEPIFDPAPVKPTLPDTPKAPSKPAQKNVSPVFKLFERPTLETAAEGFKFAPAKKITTNPCMRPPAKTVNDLSGTNTASASKPTESELAHTEATRTVPAPTEPAHTGSARIEPENMNPASEFPSKTTPAMPKVLTHLPATTTEKLDLGNTRSTMSVIKYVDTRGGNTPAEATGTRNIPRRPRSTLKNAENKSHKMPSTPAHESFRKPKSTRRGADTRNHDLPAEETEDSPHKSKPIRQTVACHQDDHTRTEIITEVLNSAINLPKASANVPMLQPRSPQLRSVPALLPPVLGHIDSNIQQAKPPTTNPRALPQNGPLTPLKPAQNAKAMQRTLSRGRQRIKQPFPEATTPEESRRWHSKASVKSRPTVTHNTPDNIRSGTPSNTGRARTPATGTPARNNDVNGNYDRNRQGPMSVITNGLGHTYGPQHIDLEIDHQANFAPGCDRTMTEPPSSPPKAVHETGNDTDAFDNMEGREFDPDPEPENDESHIVPLSLMIQHSQPSLDSDLAAAHEEAEMQRTLYDDRPQVVIGRHATDGREHNIGTSRQSTPGQGGHVRNPSKQSLALQHAIRPPSRSHSEVQSRPQSCRSDRSKPISRPVSQHDLTMAESTLPHTSQATKVKKSAKSAKQSTMVDQSKSPQPQVSAPFKLLMQLNRHSGEGLLESYLQQEALIKSQRQELEQRGAVIKEQQEEIEQKKSTLKSHEEELERLKKSETASKEDFQKLETAKAALEQAVKKWKVGLPKYIKHANEVVNAQKWLKEEGERVRKRASDAIGVVVNSERVATKLENAVKESKDLRLAADGFETVSKEKEQLVTANKQLLADKETFKQNLETLQTQLQETGAQYSREKAELKRLKSLPVAVKNNELLQNTLDDRLKDLGTEKHNTDQLQKNLDAQTTAWGELVELVKQIPSDTSKAINGDDGTLAKLLSSENTTQEKIEEITSNIKELMKRESELPPTLVKLVEDIASRLESEEQHSPGNDAILKDGVNTLLQELKDGMSQLRIDKETEISLNNKIKELEQARDNLDAQKVARDTEIESLSKQLEESRQELSSCRNALNNKDNELTAALNVPREDPALRTKIAELEKTNNALDNQAKEASQELSKVKEELVSTRKDSGSKDEQIKDLQRQLRIAQQTVEKFNGEEAKRVVLKEEEHKKTCQEIARNGESQKATLKMRLDSEMKILEQRVQERNSEVNSMREQLQILQAEAQTRTDPDLKVELSKYKDQITQFAAHMKRLEKGQPSNHDADKFTSELRSARSEIADLRLLFKSVTTETAQKIEAAAREQKVVEETLRRLDGLQKEKVTMEEHSTPLQLRPDNSRPQQLGRDTVTPSDRRSEASTTTPMPLSDSNRTSVQEHATFAVPPGSRQTDLEDDMLPDNAAVHTPENALRDNVRKAGSNSAGPSRLNEKVTGAATGAYKTPALPLPKGPVERTAFSRDSPHTSVQQYQHLTSRGLRVAPRKSNWTGASSQSENQPRPPILPGDLTPQASDQQRTPAPLKPFSDMTPLGYISSPLADLESMFDQVEPVHKEVRPREEHDMTRSKKGSGATTAEMILAPQNMSAMSANQGHANDGARDSSHPVNGPVKAQINPPSAAEESRRRRTSRPAKSAMKKTTRSSALVPGQASLYEGQPDTTRPATSTKVQSMRPPQISNIKGLVAGKSTRSAGANGTQTLASMQSTPASSQFFELQQSPPMDAPRRNRNKRLASTVLESPKPKAQRRFSLKTVIPDSQESQESI
ncbi:uncharacterized protein PAC_01763 [Phialocephala subalpina]|uniref:Uncharacterized protein n=1 Tax=Phialocephala subalpina TaxID=576137 RepID=A0A1L7WGI9_9HELO|nr:uncharacterized protein PAC_01763 [Phialocephala subalpina]